MSGAAEIFIDKRIGPGGITSLGISRELNSAGNVDRLNVLICSEGGSVRSALEIHRLLRQHPAYRVAHISGRAASAASVIAMAADEIRIAADAALMIHDPWTPGSQTQLESEQLKDIKTRLVEIYQEATGLDRQTICDMMENETWLNASEAVAAGFADVVCEPRPEIAAQYDLSRYRNHPDHLAYFYGIHVGKPSQARSQKVIKERVRYMQMRCSDIRRESGQLH